MKAQAIINTQAGTALEHSSSNIEQSIIDGFGSSTKKLKINLVSPKDLGKTLESAVKSDIDILIVAGGDGTIRAAASHLMGTDKALGIIPLGTFNRLANELHIPLGLKEATKIALTGEQKYIDVAELNGQIFLCNSIMGLPPRFSEKRQQLRGKPLKERFLGYVSIVKSIFTNYSSFSFVIDSENKFQKRRASTLVISNNPYIQNQPLSLKRVAFDTGKLGIYISQHKSFLDMLQIFVRTLLGKWQEDQKLEYYTALKLKIISSKKRLKLSNDGEVENMSPPLIYKVHPKALKVIVPKNC